MSRGIVYIEMSSPSILTKGEQQIAIYSLGFNKRCSATGWNAASDYYQPFQRDWQIGMGNVHSAIIHYADSRIDKRMLTHGNDCGNPYIKFAFMN